MSSIVILAPQGLLTLTGRTDNMISRLVRPTPLNPPRILIKLWTADFVLRQYWDRDEVQSEYTGSHHVFELTRFQFMCHRRHDRGTFLASCLQRTLNSSYSCWSAPTPLSMQCFTSASVGYMSIVCWR